jgi:hypothetical protein
VAWFSRNPALPCQESSSKATVTCQVRFCEVSANLCRKASFTAGLRLHCRRFLARRCPDVCTKRGRPHGDSGRRQVIVPCPLGRVYPGQCRRRCLPASRIALPGARLRRGAVFTRPSAYVLEALRHANQGESRRSRYPESSSGTFPQGPHHSRRLRRGCGTGCDPEGVRTP